MRIFQYISILYCSGVSNIGRILSGVLQSCKIRASPNAAMDGKTKYKKANRTKSIAIIANHKSALSLGRWLVGGYIHVAVAVQLDHLFNRVRWGRLGIGFIA